MLSHALCSPMHAPISHASLCLYYDPTPHPHTHTRTAVPLCDAQLIGDRAQEGLVAGYTALYIFVHAQDGSWEAPIAADLSHLLSIDVALSGPNDAKEQA